MSDVLKDIDVDLLQRGRYQPRRQFDAKELEELAETIRHEGVVQPLVIRPIDDGCYEILAGERRWRAAQLAGLHAVPAIVRRCGDEEAARVALIENVQREPLSVIEEAEAIRRMIDEFEMDQAQVAGAVGYAPTTVSNKLRLLNLPKGVRDMLADGRLSEGRARPLLSLGQTLQLSTAQKIVANGYSARQVERMVHEMLGKPNRSAAKPSDLASRKDPAWKRFERELTDTVGNQVAVEWDNNTRHGSLKIEFSSLDELDGLTERLAGRKSGD